jgi:hypothetical protein
LVHRLGYSPVKRKEGRLKPLPYWSLEEEQRLRTLISEGETLKDIALVLQRSPEAITKKLKRMNLALPQKHSAIPEENKVTKTTPTTTPKLKALKFEELPSPNEALGLLWAAVKRLQDPDVGREEAKKLRLILSGVKSYIHLEADYVFRTREVERRMLVMYKTELQYIREFVDRAKDPAEKEKWLRECVKLEREIEAMEAMGVTEPKKPRVGADAT